MSERTFGRQVVQYAKETTEGTALAATKRFSALSLNLDVDMNFHENKPSGSRWPYNHIPGKRAAKITSGTSDVNYNELPVVFSGLVKRVTPTTPGGTDPRDWLFQQNTFVEEVPDTFTIEKGSHESMERAVGCFFNGFNMTGNTDEVKWNVEGMGRDLQDATNDSIKMSTGEVQTVDLSGTDDPTGGTWILTILGLPTTALAFDASAAAVQTAINLLYADGARDVTVSKAGFVYTITFPYYLGNVATVTVNSASLTSGGTISVTIATTTPGVAAAELENRIILPRHVKWFSDAAYGSIGGTGLLRVFDWQVNVSGMRELFHTVNSDLNGAAAGKVETTDPTGEVVLAVEMDAVGQGFYANAKVGSTVFVRQQVHDDANSIEASYRYQLVQDFALQVKAIGNMEALGQIYGRKYTFGLVHNSTFGRAWSSAVRCKLPSL